MIELPGLRTANSSAKFPPPATSFAATDLCKIIRMLHPRCTEESFERFSL
jgi:hypothetical protein